MLAAARAELEAHWEPIAAFITADNPSGKEEFRRDTVATFLYKLYEELGTATAWTEPLPTPSSFRQAFDTAGRKAQPKITAFTQATGEAKFIDDMPVAPGTLFGALVVTTVAAGTVLSIDWAPALAAPGVTSHAAADDIPGDNDAGLVAGDEPLFLPVGGTVAHKGQALGVVLGSSFREARAAAKLVRVTYEAAVPIVSVDDAIAAGSYLEDANHVGKFNVGDVDAVLAAADDDHKVRGVVRQNGQHAFYMEKQTAMACPDERGRMQLWCSNQYPDFTRARAAAVLGVPASYVSVNMRRAGGGFGPKVTRQIPTAGAACVAAHKTRRPVRLVLPIDVDGQHVGGRHPMRTAYTASFNDDGTITGVHFVTHVQCGATYDFRCVVLLLLVCAVGCRGKLPVVWFSLASVVVDTRCVSLCLWRTVQQTPD